MLNASLRGQFFHAGVREMVKKKGGLNAVRSFSENSLIFVGRFKTYPKLKGPHANFIALLFFVAIKWK